MPALTVRTYKWVSYVSRLILNFGLRVLSEETTVARQCEIHYGMAFHLRYIVKNNLYFTGFCCIIEKKNALKKCHVFCIGLIIFFTYNYLNSHSSIQSAKIIELKPQIIIRVWMYMIVRFLENMAHYQIKHIKYENQFLFVISAIM